jgi:hypothetical protein
LFNSNLPFYAAAVALIFVGLARKYLILAISMSGKDQWMNGYKQLMSLENGVIWLPGRYQQSARKRSGGPDKDQPRQRSA